MVTVVDDTATVTNITSKEDMINVTRILFRWSKNNTEDKVNPRSNNEINGIGCWYM